MTDATAPTPLISDERIQALFDEHIAVDSGIGEFDFARAIAAEVIELAAKALSDQWHLDNKKPLRSDYHEGYLDGMDAAEQRIRALLDKEQGK